MIPSLGALGESSVAIGYNKKYAHNNNILGSYSLQQNLSQLHNSPSRHTIAGCASKYIANACAWQTSVYFTGAKKTPLSCICNSTLPERNYTIFAIESPSG